MDEICWNLYVKHRLRERRKKLILDTHLGFTTKPRHGKKTKANRGSFLSYDEIEETQEEEKKNFGEQDGK